MNILIIGGGGREHALTYRLYQSESCDKIFVNPGNPGIEEIAKCIDFDISREDELIRFCKDNDIKLVVVGPEVPLAHGITDMLVTNGIKSFGPDKFATQLESSKSFAKEFMDEYNIPTAKYKSFTQGNLEECLGYIDMQKLPIVIKADGLAAGKGVLIAYDKDEAKEYVNEIFDGKFGDAGTKIVIEEFMTGQEASVFAICDGKNYITLSPSQDHKRALEGDKGLNTGGMGAYAPTKFVPDHILEKVRVNIIDKVLKGMAEKGHPFIGCLYCGLMIENDEPKIVEFNVRFGDPETQSILTLVEGDFAELLYSAANGQINKESVNIINDKYSCTVILASQGYPESYEKGNEITGLDSKLGDDLFIFHAGTKKVDGKIVNNGGRVLAITALGDSLQESKDKAYKLVEKVNFSNKFYRKDIADKGL